MPVEQRHAKDWVVAAATTDTRVQPRTACGWLRCCGVTSMSAGDRRIQGALNVLFGHSELRGGRLPARARHDDPQEQSRNALHAGRRHPLLFAVQQLRRGVIWWTFSHDAPLLNSVMTHVLSFFS